MSGNVKFFKEFSYTEKFEKFGEYVQAPILNITIFLLVLFIILGISIIELRTFYNKDNKAKLDKVIKILRNIFVVVCLLLSLFSIYIGCQFKGFSIENGEDEIVLLNNLSASQTESQMLVSYIAYIVIMFISAIVGIKTKNKKIIYITAVCLAILITIINFVCYINLNVGTYVF